MGLECVVDDNAYGRREGSGVCRRGRNGCVCLLCVCVCELVVWLRMVVWLWTHAQNQSTHMSLKTSPPSVRSHPPYVSTTQPAIIQMSERCEVNTMRVCVCLCIHMCASASERVRFKNVASVCNANVFASVRKPSKNI